MNSFVLSRKVSLVDIVIDAAKQMGEGVNLTCLTFEMPQTAGVKLLRAQNAGILKSISVYMEANHRRKKNWVSAMVLSGWNIYNVKIHAKIALLENHNCKRVFLSSNNWQAGGCLEFCYEIPDTHIVDEIFQQCNSVLSEFVPLK